MTTTTTPLRAGLWLWCWPEARMVSDAELTQEALAVGATGVIIHAVGAAKPALAWLAKRTPALDAVGLASAVAIGSRGPGKWLTALADPVIEALGAGLAVGVDSEGAWDHPEGELAAQKLVARVLANVPDAAARCFDAPWWAPDLHAGFPLTTFGRLCRLRAPQCYTDAPARALAHARREYPRRGTPATQVIATVRGYARATAEVASFALAEPFQLCWMGSAKPANRLTPEVRAGLQAAAKIRSAGFGDVASWQTAAGLTADGVVGARSLAALGVT